MLRNRRVIMETKAVIVYNQIYQRLRWIMKARMRWMAKVGVAAEALAPNPEGSNFNTPQDHKLEEAIILVSGSAAELSLITMRKRIRELLSRAGDFPILIPVADQMQNFLEDHSTENIKASGPRRKGK
jgi:hypothetical protein